LKKNNNSNFLHQDNYKNKSFNNNSSNNNKIKLKNKKMMHHHLINKHLFIKVQLSVKLQNNCIRINKYLKMILIIILIKIITKHNKIT